MVLMVAKKYKKFQVMIVSGFVLIIAVSAYLLEALHLMNVFLWNPIWETRLENNFQLYDIKTFPLIFGAGLGNLENMHNYYVRPSQTFFATDFYAPHLLQLVNGTGLIGAGLLIGFLFTLMRKTYPAWMGRSQPNTTYLYVGSVSSLITLIITGFVGPGLSLTNAMYSFAVLSALIVIIPNTQSTKSLAKTRLSYISKKNCGTLYVAITIIMMSAITFQSGEVIGKQLNSQIETNDLESHAEKNNGDGMLGRYIDAVSFAPLNNDLRIALADKQYAAGNAHEAINQYFKCLRISPLSGRNLSRLSLVYELSGDYDKALELLDTSSKLSFPVDDYHRRLLLKLLEMGNTESAKRQIRLAISQEPNKTDNYIGMLRLYNQNLEDFESYLPEMWEPYLELGDYMLSAGNKVSAEKCYQIAFAYALQHIKPEAEPFIRVIRYFLQEGHNDEALKLAVVSVNLISYNAELHYLMGMAYENSGIVYRAIEEYRIALLVDPEHVRASERLTKLLHID